jgi:hypothetical protein
MAAKDPWNVVRLDPEEHIAGAIVGFSRYVYAKTFGFKNEAGLEERTYETDIEGACAEIAVAKTFGLYWPFSMRERHAFKDPDLAYTIQVRQSDKRSLIVRPKDKPEHRYIFAQGKDGTFVIRGWMWGYEAKQDQYWMEPNGRPGAWFVPWNKLRHPASVLDVLEE